jgi:MFS family permease
MLAPTFLAFALLAVGMLVPNTFGTLAVFMQPDLGFDDAQLGQLLAIFWLGTSLFAVSSGGLADRTGWRISALTGCLVCSMTVAVLAFSRGFTTLALAMLLGAVGYGFCSPTSNLIVMRLVALGRQAFSFGIKQTAPTAITIAGGLLIPVLASRFGWRTVVVLAVPVLLLPIGFAVLWRPDRQASEGRRVGQLPLLAGGGGRKLVLLTCANGLGTFGMAGASGFGVRSLVEAGMDLSRAGAALGVASAAALSVRVVGGWWLDRLSTRGNLALLGLVAVGAVGAALMATGAPWVMVVGIVLSLCGSWSWPPLLLMKVLQRFPHAPGSASGHLQVGASIGAASGPLALGFVVQQTSYAAGWLMIVVSAVVAASLILRATRR